MKTKIITFLKVMLIVLIIALSISATVFFIRYEMRQKDIKENIEYVYHIYNKENTQEMLNDYIKTEGKELGVKIETSTQEIETQEIQMQETQDTQTQKIEQQEIEKTMNALAVLEIPKIDFKDIVLEGTTQDVLADGIGLFEHSSILEGNVCLAGHNSTRFFKRLNELELRRYYKILILPRHKRVYC